jgi:hypothetical protein
MRGILRNAIRHTSEKFQTPFRLAGLPWRGLLVRLAAAARVSSCLPSVIDGDAQPNQDRTVIESQFRYKEA